MNIIIIESEELAGDVVRLSDERFQHIRRVLRLAVGHSLRVGLLNGPLGEAVVKELDETGVELRCRWFEPEQIPCPQIDLLLAMPRPKVMRRLWAQVAAMGVSRILVCNAEKVEKGYFDSQALDPVRIRKWLIEGLQQSGATYLPEVSVHRRFRPLMEDELAAYTDKRVAIPGGGTSVREASEAERVLLAIGPEGGWSPFELGIFAEQGFRPVGMGDRILRSDTACIAALALLRDALFPFPAPGEEHAG
jgi:RsmE family RNA methyltransferase